MRILFLTIMLSIVAACSSATAQESEMWWNDGWRFRTIVTRATPWRDTANHPVEVAVDFEKLLEGAEVKGTFDPASVRVIDPTKGNAGEEIPFAYRTEFDPETGCDNAWLAWTAQPTKGVASTYHIYFDTVDRGMTVPQYDPSALPCENLLQNSGFENSTGNLPTDWKTTAPALMQLDRFKHTTGERSLKIVVEEKAPENAEGILCVSQKVDVRQYAGQEMVFECDLFAERAPYGAPVSIAIQQFRADGSRLLECAVQPRWLTLELAEGQLVQFRERGRISPDAATVNVRIQLRCLVIDADTEQPITGPDSFFTVWLDRVVVRPGERWAWPAETHSGFVTGALEEMPFNRGFDFTGSRRLIFNGASEGSLQSGTFNPNPRSVHWGLETGTLEFWCRPSWKADEDHRRVFFESDAWGGRAQSRLSKVRDGDEDHLKFLLADADGVHHEISGPAPFKIGQWHHVAATWDLPKAHLQLFFDGKRIADEGPGSTPWPSSLFATGGIKKSLGAGLSLDDTRSMPRQAFIGGDGRCRPEESAECTLDEFRISDVTRYKDNFVPARREFNLDPATRALFHLDNERHGVHASDDQFVHGHLVCEVPPQEETAPLEIRASNGNVDSQAVLVRPYPKPTGPEPSQIKSAFTMGTQDQDRPDPRFIEHIERHAERMTHSQDDTFALTVEGDLEPLMESITFQHANAADTESVSLPHWRANDNVVPLSIQTLAATLAPDIKDEAKRTIEVFKYAANTSYYFNARHCATFATHHRSSPRPTLLKALNIYPFDVCGPLNFTLRKLYLAVGISSNDALGTQHEFQQAFYLGKWRLLDVSTRRFWLDRDNKSIVGKPAFERDLYLMVRNQGFRGNMLRGEPYEPLFGKATRPHNMDFSLHAGEMTSLCWHNEGRWFELQGEREPLPLGAIPPRYGNGAIMYSPVTQGKTTAFTNMSLDADSDGDLLRAVNPEEDASIVYRVQCPYILSDAQVRGTYKAARAHSLSLSLSFDNGQTWTRVWTNDEKNGDMTASLLNHVTARYAYWLKIDMEPDAQAHIKGFRVRTTFVASTLSLPGKLSLGENRITFVGGSPKAPIKTTCRWLERRKTDLGVSFNTLSYPTLNDQPPRNLMIASPENIASLAVSLGGRQFDGTVRIEGMPETWLQGPPEQPVTTKETGPWETARFQIKPTQATLGDIHRFDVVLHEGEHERREAVQVLVAESPLACQAEAANEVSGDVAPEDIPGASAGRVMKFTGEGALKFKLSVSQEGEYALWLRAEWGNRWDAKLTLTVDDAEPRMLQAALLRGSGGWERPNTAFAKALSSFGGQGAFWYRIPDVKLSEGEHVLMLGTPAKANFDALVLLPQTAVMDRAASNLFHNWDYAPWRNPF